MAELDAQHSALKARLSKTERLGEWLSRELPGFLTCDNDKALFADLIGPGLPGTAETGDGVQGAR
ncbi:hypothetical protein A6U84_21280 [Agrobacterium sp. 13-2099-1-2]|uniref:hypothetical protein n=1 Tax=Agrobacterium sp. 13-2099-1-2 TaxID=1841651 RepID=UPI0009F3F562|nr:hypothetical protein [Agrobacterium sp. 13-2099-1-2]UZX44925.1 hypothetical protein A6U84_21280 [Agrobacterium sp. 13-2099-1-2]